MSEQTKGNLQVFGAGLFGFVAVVGAAGALLSSFGGGSAPASPARAPIEAGVLSLSAPAASTAVPQPRPASPQPLLGALDEPLVEESAAAPAHARAAAPTSARAAGAAPAALDALGAPRHYGKGESVSSARARAKTFAVKPAAPDEEPEPKETPRIKLDTTRTAVASSVHYGVTSRNELMGRAAGPVYNFKGAKPAASGRGAELAADASAKLDALEKEVDANEALTAEQKAEIKRKIGQKK